MHKLTITILISVMMLIAAPLHSEPSQARKQALDILWGAYTKLQQGDPTAIDGIEQALKIDPNFAYANIVRAEYAMAEEDWDNALTYYQKGLEHLREPNQPLSPLPSIKITADEVEGDTRVFLGYTYIKLAQRANVQGKSELEQKYLSAAEKNLRKSLILAPGPESKAMADRLLRMFH
jgi:tetratricopeptide (TPR) repeat protein